ncbi:MAG TPA: AsmA family protein [Xanthobacteraceae bacterium]|nr:AsmA family protein [Xanthobacteraceae bacterium]
MRRIFPILAASVLLVAAAAFAVPLLTPEATLREQAAKLLRDEAGIAPQIDGAASFTLLPRPAIHFERVSFPALAPSALDVREVRIDLELLPLLTGRVKAARVDLIEPDLDLSDADRDTIAAILPVFAAALAPPARRAHVRVFGGVVRLVEDGARRSLVSGLEGTFVLRGGRDLVADGQLDYRGETVGFELGLFDLPALASTGGGAASLSLTGAPLRLSFEGHAKLAGGPFADGALVVTAPQLRGLLEWIGFSAPTEGGFGPFRFQARTQISPTNAVLSEARIDLDGSRSEGGLAVKMDHGRPVLQGSFASGDLDLSPYGRLVISEPDGGAWSRRAFDIGWLGALDADLRFSAARVRAGTTAIDGVAASAVLKGGRLALALGEAEAWGGTFRASANLAPSPQRPGAEVRVELGGNEVNLALALGDLLRMQRLEGTGSFQVALSGTGVSVADIIDHLGGTIAMDAADGSLIGVDVVRLLGRLERRPLSGGGDVRGRTAFATMDAKASIDRGIASIDRFAVESPALRIAITGQASVPERGLDLKGTASLVKPPAAVGAVPVVAFDLPFVVQGPWSSPFVLPDPRALIQRSGAARPLLGTHAPAAGGVAVPGVVQEAATPAAAAPQP